MSTMNLSSKIDAQITCGRCGVVFDENIWMVVDGAHDSDAAARARRGELRVATCPNGHSASFDLRLLVILPDSEPGAFYLPARSEEIGESRAIYEAFVAKPTNRPSLQPDVSVPRVLPPFDEICLVEPERSSSPGCYYSCNDLPGTTRRFARLVQQARQADAARHADCSPDAFDAAVAAWEAIVLHRAFSTAPIWFRRGALSEAGAAWFLRASPNSNTACLNRTIELMEQVVSLTRPGATSAGAFYNLGIALRDRFYYSGAIDDLQRAIDVLTRAIETAEDEFVLPHMQNAAGETLMSRYNLHGDPADLDRATVLLRSSVETADALGGASDRMLGSLSSALHVGHKRTPSEVLLDEAIAVADRGVNVGSPENARDFVAALNARALARETRYLDRDDVADLNNAIQDLEQAADLAPSAAQKALVLSNLGGALRNRFSRQGRMADLQEAWRRTQEALSLLPPSSTDVVPLLNNWASTARDLFLQDNRLDWLDSAIAAFEKAIAACPSGDSRRMSLQTNLGGCLVRRFKATLNLADLEVGITALKDALHNARPASQSRADALVNLAMAQVEMGGEAKTPGLSSSIEMLDEALALVPDTSLDAIQIGSNLALLLSQRHLAQRDPRDAARALAIFRHYGAQAEAHTPSIALGLAQNWASWCLRNEEWVDAAEAANLGLRAAERIAAAQADLTGKSGWLRSIQTLGAIAAHAFARTGDSRGAVVAIERGRTRFLRERNARREIDLERLGEAGRSDLAELYREALRSIEVQDKIARLVEFSNDTRQSGPPLTTTALWTRSGVPQQDGFNFDVANAFEAKRREAHRTLETCITEIRGVDGFERFLREIDWDDVLACLASKAAGAAEADAVVYLAVSGVSGLALVVVAGEAHAVWLDIDRTKVAQWLVGEGDSRAGYILGQLAHTDIQEDLQKVLLQLGDLVVGPLAAELRRLGVQRVAEDGSGSLVLIPTGTLSMLPLHVAPYSSPDGVRTLLDDYAVVYGVSASLWQACAKRVQRRELGTSALVVGNPLPLPPDWDPLEAADAEADAVALLLGREVTCLHGGDATLDRVISGLRQATYVHFAAHAEFDLAVPMNTGLLLAGGARLRPFEIGDHDQCGPRLVVLSACQSAMTDIQDLPEEAVGLGTMLLGAGAAGVIGSLWPVDDLSTAFLMVRFYIVHLGANEKTADRPRLAPPAALRSAQLWLRDLSRDSLQRMCDEPAPNISSRVMRDLARLFMAQDTSEFGTFPFRDAYFWSGFVCHGR